MDKRVVDGMFVVMTLKEEGWSVIITLKSEAMDMFEDTLWNMYSTRLDAWYTWN